MSAEPAPLRPGRVVSPGHQFNVDVLHVVPAYHPARGGVEVLVENLAERLRCDFGMSSAVLAPSIPGERPADYVHRGTRVHSVEVAPDVLSTTSEAEPTPLPPRQTLALMSGVYSAIRQVITRTTPSLMHVHAASMLAPGAVSIATSRGIPHLMHVHGTIHAGDPPNFRNRVRDADWVCAVADAVAESIRRDCQRTGPIDVIRNGVVDPSGTILPLRPSSPSVAMIGRLSQEKGFDDGLRALSHVHRRRPDLRIRIVGSGPAADDLHGLAVTLGLVDAVEYFGRLENSDALRVAAGSDLVLVPSREEGFCLVAVEAALLGLPVVATTAGGLPETIVDGSTGLLVPPGDHSAMAAAVERLLGAANERVMMGRRARERALDQFSMERFTHEIADVYDRMRATTAGVRSQDGEHDRQPSSIPRSQ